MFSHPKMQEMVLVGHGAMDTHDGFQLPDNCYVIMYSPDNFSLSNSAIEAISRLHAECKAQNQADVEHFVNLANDILDSGNVILYEPGDLICHHFLHPLADREGVGSDEHKKQFVSAIRLFASNFVAIQDARSLTRKNKVQANLDGSVNLEDVTAHYAKQAEKHNGMILIHWLACRRDIQKKYREGQTRSLGYSLTERGRM